MPKSYPTTDDIYHQVILEMEYLQKKMLVWLHSNIIGVIGWLPFVSGDEEAAKAVKAMSIK